MSLKGLGLIHFGVTYFPYHIILDHGMFCAKQWKYFFHIKLLIFCYMVWLLFQLWNVTLCVFTWMEKMPLGGKYLLLYLQICFKILCLWQMYSWTELIFLIEKAPNSIPQMFTKIRSSTLLDNMHYKMIAKLGLKSYAFGKTGLFYYEGA